jgi:sugar phosphate isomerase/epimerase
MGEGVCDYRRALELLEDMEYGGWVIAEEESKEAREDQKNAVTGNRKYLSSLGY